MLLPDGTILMHDATHAYDPVKAHQYYIRTRELKGRKKGAVGTSGPARKGRESAPAPLPTSKQVQRSTDQQIADIRRKLEILKSRRSSGDVQKRTAIEKSQAAKKKADMVKAAQKEASTIRKELSDLSVSLKDKKKSAQEKEDIKTKISDAKARLAAAEEKVQTLSE